MKRLFTIILITHFFSSCSQINTESRDYYSERSSSFDRSHGLVMSDEEGDQSSLLLSVNEDSVKRGKVIYQNHCMKCHGHDGQGNGPAAKEFKYKPLNLKNAIASNPGFRFFISVSKSAKVMPGWENKDFSEKDLSDLTQYLRSLVN